MENRIESGVNFEAAFFNHIFAEFFFEEFFNVEYKVRSFDVLAVFFEFDGLGFLPCFFFFFIGDEFEFMHTS